MQWISTNFQNNFPKLLETTTLSRLQKEIIRARYIDMVLDAESDYRRTWLAYIVLTNLITISGVLIAALIPIEHLGWISSTGSLVVFWIVWSLAIVLTLSNKMVHSFNILKKYVLNTITLQKLYCEGWSFISGVDRYKKCATVDDRFILFCSRVEKIKTKSLESIPEMEYDNTVILAGGSAVPNAPCQSPTPLQSAITREATTQLVDNIADDSNYSTYSPHSTHSTHSHIDNTNSELLTVIVQEQHSDQQ